MKYVNIVLFVFLPFLGLLAQEDFEIEDFSCSQKARFWNEQHNKSALHPNHLLEKYDVKFYGLDLNANDTTDDLSGNVEILLQVTAPFLDTLLVEFSSKLAADSLFVNGISVPFTTTDYTLQTILGSSALHDSLISFRLFYHTPEDYSSSFFASTRHPSYDDYPVTQTISEPYFLSEWMPCKQVLIDKADSVHVFITVDTALKVAGPGMLTIVPIGGGKHRFEWRIHHTVAYYLIFFAVSDYREYTIYAKPANLDGDSIPIVNYLFKHSNNQNTIPNQVNWNKNTLELFSNLYGDYPYQDEKYGHYLWNPPLFNAMEHITMTGLIDFSSVATSHELGHSWFGNSITCASWQDIWINEGFATYSVVLAFENQNSVNSGKNYISSIMNYALTMDCGSVYVPEQYLNYYNRIFSGKLSYAKGASLLHMIRYIIDNDSTFFNAIQTYYQEFKDSVATGEDFRLSIENSTNINFQDFFTQFYYGEGHPIYKLIWEQINDSLILDLHQSTSCNTTPLYTIPMEYRIIGNNGLDTIVRLNQYVNDTTYILNFSEDIVEVELDPNNGVFNTVDTVLQRASFNLKVLLEGTYDTLQNQMTTLLNPNLIPFQHPYSVLPWECSDSTHLIVVPENIVDWILLEARTSSLGADSALPQNVLFKKAYLLDKEGVILDLDGVSHPKILLNTQDSIYLIIRHRNHLPIMSAHALSYYNREFSYDFTTNPNTIYGGNLALSQLEEGVYGMTVSDANANDSITMEDYNLWKNDAGKNGYLQTDFDLNKQADNRDKNTFWLLHLNQEAILPEYK